MNSEFYLYENPPPPFERQIYGVGGDIPEGEYWRTTATMLCIMIYSTTGLNKHTGLNYEHSADNMISGEDMYLCSLTI
jgi:hypothetical protein